MKYYSEKTKKLYESEKELKEAEKGLLELEVKEKEKREQRSARAKEVEEAYKNYQKLLKDFIKDYGSYHMSLKDGDSVFDYFFNHFFF